MYKIKVNDLVIQIPHKYISETKEQYELRCIDVKNPIGIVTKVKNNWGKILFPNKRRPSWIKFRDLQKLNKND